MPPELPRIAVRLDQDLDPHRCVELAVVAETSGYSSLWFAENPLHRAILPAVSACALQTDRSLALCGELADGLIVSNLCPPGYTRRAVELVQQSAAAAGRKALDIVQYVPCAVRADREEAKQVAKSAIGEMLAAFWPVGSDWPELRETSVRHSGISKTDMVAALAWLRRGEPPDRVLDDRFVEAFAIAGTAEECLATASRYRLAGVDELVLTFVGTRPVEQMHHLGRALPEHRI